MLMVVGSVAIGLIVGFTIGGLGGGGSVLTVPALVYVLGESPRSASGASLIIVGISALIGLTAHARDGRVRWTAGAVFGLIGTGAAVLGTVISKQLDPNVLMLAFAGIILLAAAFMIHQAIKPAAAPAEPDGHHDGDGDATVSTPRSEPGNRATLGTIERTRRIPWRRGGLVVVAGAAVGFATGLFGVGGGFLVVPALVLALGYTMPTAVPTSLLVIAINSASSLAPRLFTDTFDWSTIAPVTGAAVVSTVVGKGVADRLSSRTLARAFATLLILVAGYTATTSIAALL